MASTYETSTNVCPLIYVGTYESYLDPNERFDVVADMYMEDGMVEEDFDGDKYLHDLGQRAAKVLKDFVDCITEGGYGIVAVESDGGIIRPRYHGYIAYNFGTDELSLRIRVSDDFYKIARTHLEEWKDNPRIKKYIKDQWKSRDGFISFMPESVEDFIKELDENFADGGSHYGQDLLVGGYCALCAVDANYPNEHFMEYDGQGCDCGFDPVQEELVEAVEDMNYENYAVLREKTEEEEKYGMAWAHKNDKA